MRFLGVNETKLFEIPVSFKIKRNTDGVFEVESENATSSFEEMFATKSTVYEIFGDVEKITLKSDRIIISTEKEEMTYNYSDFPETKISSNKLTISGGEGWGKGDANFLAVCAPFLGGGGLIFSVVAASFYGVLYHLIFNRNKKSNSMPLIPFLSFGAFTWLLFGNSVLNFLGW